MVWTNKNNDDFSQIKLYSGEDPGIQQGSLANMLRSQAKPLNYQTGNLTHNLYGSRSIEPVNGFTINGTSIFHGMHSKAQYQKEILAKINNRPIEDIPLLINDEDPIVRKLAEIRLAAGK